MFTIYCPTVASHNPQQDHSQQQQSAEQTDPARVMIGDGPIDLASEIRMLRETGYQGTISLELFNPQLWEADPLQVAQLFLRA